MGVWNWLFGGDMTPVTTDVNPATGLPMLGDVGGVDVGGNPFGMNLSDHTIDSLSSPMGGADSSVDFWGD